MFDELMYSIAWAIFSRRAKRHAEQLTAYNQQRGPAWSMHISIAMAHRAEQSAAILAKLNGIR